MKFNKAKALLVDQGNSKHNYSLSGEWMENSPEEKDFGMFVGKKLPMTQQCVPAAQKANHILGCIPSNVTKGRDSAYLQHSDETLAAALCPALGQ